MKAPFPLKAAEALGGPAGPRGACELLMELRSKQAEEARRGEDEE